MLDEIDQRERVEVDSTNGRKWWRRVVVIVGAAVLVAALLVASPDGTAGQIADITVQGGELTLAEGGARLVRDADGVFARADIPTPAPGSYVYPSSDMTPPWSAPHPDVAPADEDGPEVFTLWLFHFNHPERCTDGACDLDDLGTDTAARGGAVQVDGRITDGDRLVLEGRVRVGQPSADGAVLESPEGAEVHFAIAPHGRALEGSDLWRQLNGPIGNPTLWWTATFLP